MTHKCPSKTGFFKVDNLFGEILTEAQRTLARKNLGIADENFLYWKNMKGFPEDSVDLMNVIKEKVFKEVSASLSESPEALKKLQELVIFFKTNPDGLVQLTNQVIENTNKLNKLDKVKYLTYEEYQQLVDNNLIEDDVEYNIFEEE